MHKQETTLLVKLLKSVLISGLLFLTILHNVSVEILMSTEVSKYLEIYFTLSSFTILCRVLNVSIMSFIVFCRVLLYSVEVYCTLSSLTVLCPVLLYSVEVYCTLSSFTVLSSVLLYSVQFYCTM